MTVSINALPLPANSTYFNIASLSQVLRKEGSMLNRNNRLNRGFCVPGYRWCGPGCSGPGSPTNAVDSCCQSHDRCYEKYGPTEHCDRIFQNCLRPYMNTRNKMGRDASLFYGITRLNNRFR